MIMRTIGVIAFMSLVGVASVNAENLYVATNRVDTLTCGSRLEPCRSISRAILLATDDAKIIVGAGRYGDANGDGNLDDPGDESGQLGTGCYCVLLINKRVQLEAQHGTGSVAITGRAFYQLVQVTASGAVFGRTGRGFVLVGMPPGFGGGPAGVDVTAASGVTVTGNRLALTFNAAGIRVSGEGHMINDNVLYGSPAIVVSGNGHRIERNTLMSSLRVEGSHHSIVQNFITGDSGLEILGDGHVIRRNSILGAVSVMVVSSVNLTFTENNIFGNRFNGENCGLTNGSLAFLDASNNYWGAATGPGPDPADEVCNFGSGSVTAVSPWATQAFEISIAM